MSVWKIIVVIEGYVYLKYLLIFLFIYLFYFILYVYVYEYYMYKDYKNKLRNKKEGIIGDLMVV